MNVNETTSVPPTSGDQPNAGRQDAAHSALGAALLALAVVSRGATLYQFGGNLADDRDAYLAIAENIVAGRGFGFPEGSINGSPSAYRPPLYPWLLAVVAWSGGGNDRLVRWGIGAVQLALGTATVWLTVLIARRLGLGRASLLPGLLVAIDPLLLYNTARVMTETTAAFLATLLLWVSLCGRGIAGRFATGLVFGLCCLCRPTFWVFGTLAFLGWLFVAWRNRGAASVSQANLVKEAAAALLGTGLVVGPWVCRNVIEMGRPIVTTTHGGYTLLLAHNPLYTRKVVDQPWGTVWDVEADSEWPDWYVSEMRREEPSLDLRQPASPALEIARDRWMSARAWRYIREHPGTAVRSGMTLLGRFWNITPHQTADRRLPQPVRWSIGAFYALVFGFAIAGMLRLRRGQWPDWWPLLALIAAFAAVHFVYWADMRMRAPLGPAIAVFAGWGLAAPRR